MQNLSLFETNSQLFTVDNHLSFNLDDHTNHSLAMFSSLTENKSYTPINGCILEHVLTTTNLTSCEKLYYLLTDSLALINKNNGHGRSCALPSEDWAEYLGCSRSLVFAMQQSLVNKGYFIINKDFDTIGRNKRNLITPTLPASVFNHLNEKFPDRVGDHAPYNPLRECKRSYLDRTKLFIKLNYDLLKIITSHEYLTHKQKTLWLGFYNRCYKHYMLLAKEDFALGKYSYNDDSSFSFITSYQELADLYSCSTKHLSKSIRDLEELGFIKTQNIYIKKRCSDNDDCRVQERQDQSLWKITLSLPESCILELEKVKDRSNLKLKEIKSEVAVIKNTIDPKLIEDCLILGGVKFNLNLEQSEVLKSLIENDINDNGGECKDNIDLLQSQYSQSKSDISYVNSIMAELDADDAGMVDDKAKESAELEDVGCLSDAAKMLPTSSSLEALDDKEKKSNGIKSDPHVAKSGLLYNKDLKEKIKDIKSNLGLMPKVLFNNFLKRFKKNDNACEETLSKENVAKEFNIHSELIREKLKILPKDKADKARKFAYSLVSKGLAKGYAASLSKHELAKQIIHHAATWKPTKLGRVSREKEIDTALSVAWKKIASGTWQVPLELAKAEVLQYEFRHYRQKYQESGVLSHEAKALESDVNGLLSKWCNLAEKITEGINVSGAIEGNTSSIRDVDVYASINVPELGLEEREYQRGSCPSTGLELDNSFVFDLVHDQRSDSFDHDYSAPEECSNLLNISLSHIPEQQRYLKVTPSDIKGDDSIRLETIGGREYCVRLKELEMNENGEFVMTLKPAKDNMFFDYAKEASLFEQNGSVSLDAEKPLNIELMAQGLSSSRQPMQQDFTEPEDGFLKDFLQFTKKG